MPHSFFMRCNMNWKQIKIATLQKMVSANGNEYPSDNSAKDYLDAMPQACNEALQILSTANKYIIKSIQIANMPIKNLLSNDISKKIYNLESGIKEFTADGAKSYYLECYGIGTVVIKVGDTTTTIDIDSSGKYTAYRGLIENTNNESVSMTVTATYPLAIKSIALYGASFASEDDVVPFTETAKFNLKEIAPDFYMMDNEVFFEGNESDGRYEKCTNYGLEGGKIFVVDREIAGSYTIYYKAYPDEITSNTPDTYELPLASEVATLLPLYMASQIYKDDDIGIATTYRNEFEVARELLQNPSTNSKYESVESESGWA